MTERAGMLNMNRVRKWDSGVWAGVVIFFGSILLLKVSSRYAYSSDIGPGPGFFPMWLSGLLLVLSLFYIFASLKGKNPSEESWPGKTSLLKLVWILICMILFVVLAPILGFVASSSVVLFLLFLRSYRWYLNLALSVGISLIIFWIFYHALGVLLPVNEFGF
jgi:hypothetical protein